MALPPTSSDAHAPPAPASYLDLIAPQRPHDDLSFEELATRYNFRLTSDRRRVFARLVIKECQRCTAPVRVLDVGCGRGIGRQPEYQWAIRQHADEFWGLDPDTTVSAPYQIAAALPEARRGEETRADMLTRRDDAGAVRAEGARLESVLAGRRETVSRVRIPLPPPLNISN